MSEPRDPKRNPSDVEHLVGEVRRLLESRKDLAFAYLFGSHAKGTARADSDMDLGVVFRQESRADGPGRAAERALELEAELERAIERPVQAVDLESAPPGLVQNVLQTGTLICRPDRAVHAAFYVRHANRYFDLAPARAIFDRYRARRIEQGEFGGREGDRP